MRKKKKTPGVTMIATFVPDDDLRRLDHIIKAYRFKSRYKLFQYVLQAFMKVADPQPDEVVNKDIEEMFDGYETASKDDFQGTKSKYKI